MTQAESLSHDRFWLTSDVDPLRETGGALVEYTHPLDTSRWAERITFYVNHPFEVDKWEAKIRHDRNPRTWHEATAELVNALHRAHARRFVD